MELIQKYVVGILQKIDYSFLTFILLVKKKFNLVNRYQPDPFDKSINNNIARACESRFDALTVCLPEEPLSVLDFGCNEGYFCFRLSERGGLCIGIDWGYEAINYARGIAKYHQIENTLFVRQEITYESIDQFPIVDLVICFSIYHHWARKLGEKTAFLIMQKIANRTNRFMVFETGQPDETDKKWAKDLDFMGHDHVTWCQGFLEKLGFNKVTILGEHATNLSPIPRTLFLAEKLEFHKE
jgi:SAM-dependent methyltransferase